MITKDTKGEKNVYMRQVFRQEKLLHRLHLCIFAYSSSGSLLIPHLLSMQLKNWDVFQDGWVWLVSGSQARGNTSKKQGSINLFRSTQCCSFFFVQEWHWSLLFQIRVTVGGGNASQIRVYSPISYRTVLPLEMRHNITVHHKKMYSSKHFLLCSKWHENELWQNYHYKMNFYIKIIIETGLFQKIDKSILICMLYSE